MQLNVKITKCPCMHFPNEIMNTTCKSDLNITTSRLVMESVHTQTVLISRACCTNSLAAVVPYVCSHELMDELIQGFDNYKQVELANFLHSSNSISFWGLCPQLFCLNFVRNFSKLLYFGFLKIIFQFITFL